MSLSSGDAPKPALDSPADLRARTGEGGEEQRLRVPAENAVRSGGGNMRRGGRREERQEGDADVDADAAGASRCCTVADPLLHRRLGVLDGRNGQASLLVGVRPPGHLIELLLHLQSTTECCQSAAIGRQRHTHTRARAHTHTHTHHITPHTPHTHAHTRAGQRRKEEPPGSRFHGPGGASAMRSKCFTPRGLESSRVDQCAAIANGYSARDKSED